MGFVLNITFLIILSVFDLVLKSLRFKNFIAFTETQQTGFIVERSKKIERGLRDKKKFENLWFRCCDATDRHTDASTET